MNSIKSSLEFIRLHFSLLKRLYFADLVFYLVSLLYLFIEIPVADPFRPIVFLFLLCSFFVIVHIKMVNNHIGGISYYKTLPFGGIHSTLLAHLVVFLPFFTSISFTALIVIIIGKVFSFNAEDIILRAGQILFIYSVIKLITLPVMFLFRRHPAVLPGYFFLMIPIGVSVLILDELFWIHLPFRYLWGMGQFVFILYMLETIIITKSDIRYY